MTNLCVINIYDYGYSQTWLQTFILIYAHILVVGSLEVVLLWKVCKKLLFALLSLRHNEQHLMQMDLETWWKMAKDGLFGFRSIRGKVSTAADFGWSCIGTCSVPLGLEFMEKLMWQDSNYPASCLWMKMCSRVNLAGWKALTTAVTCSPLRSGQFRGKIKGNGV